MFKDSSFRSNYYSAVPQKLEEDTKYFLSVLQCTCLTSTESVWTRKIFIEGKGDTSSASDNTTVHQVSIFLSSARI